MKQMTYEDGARMRAIHVRLLDRRIEGAQTSNGEPMSLAAIARTLDPPVSPAMMTMVVKNDVVSERVRAAIERELGETYWFIKGRRVA